MKHPKTAFLTRKHFSSREDKMALFNVVEKFISINGEGRKAGELAVFIRFKGCNLRCVYCDTLYALTSDAESEGLSDDEILDYVLKSKIKNVTLTGGEPLIQKDVFILIKRLIENNISVEIETNGSILIKDFFNETIRPSFTLDYKTPDSGVCEYMCMDNYNYLNKDDTVKFVCSGITDLQKTKEIIKEYDLTNKCNVYISTVFGKLLPKDAVQFMIDNCMNDVKLQLQMHKYIWDKDKRGV